MSALGKVGSLVKNLKYIGEWQASLDDNKLPVWRGLQLSREDRIQRDVISIIMCQGYVRFEELDAKFGIDFSDHFALELESHKPPEEDGLLEVSEQAINVTSTGLSLLRVIGMKFDEYLIKDKQGKSYSNVI